MVGKLRLSDIDVVLFDLDGTVYYGTKIIPGANETIRFFRDRGVRVFFATNNSTKTRKQIHERLVGMGIDCSIDEVLSSGYLAAQYAKLHKMRDIHIFGSLNLVSEFQEAGIMINQGESAENLLIGYDPSMTYEGLASALQVAMHAKCIIACNKERTFPGEGARRMPGCGAMTAPIEWCAERECDVIVGKPNPLMIEHIAKSCGVNMSRILMVGDTYESDVRMALSAGCKAIYIGEDLSCDVPVVASIAGIPGIVDVEK